MPLTWKPLFGGTEICTGLLPDHFGKGCGDSKREKLINWFGSPDKFIEFHQQLVYLKHAEKGSNL